MIGLFQIPIAHLFIKKNLMFTLILPRKYSKGMDKICLFYLFIHLLYLFIFIFIFEREGTQNL